MLSIFLFFVSAKKIVLFDNTTAVDKCVLFASEFFGTWILVFVGCLGCVGNLQGVPPPHEQIALTFGFAVMLGIQVSIYVPVYLCTNYK